MERKLLPPEVAAFVTIVQGTQTRELHKWNRESLDRALQWAKVLESTSAKWDQQLMDEQLRNELPTATLPRIDGGGPERISIASLSNATSVLLHAVLQSAFLSSHPIRAELCIAVVKALKQHEAQHATSGFAGYNETISQCMAQQVRTERRTAAMLEVAALMSQGTRPIRVQVLDHSMTIPCLQSYLLHPRTLQLRSLAKTLQANAIGAKALSLIGNSDAYQALLDGLASQLRAADSHSIEVIALLVLQEWEPGNEEIRTDVVQLLQQWTSAAADGSTSSTLRRFLVFPPWCAARLASLASSLADQYIPLLLREGFLHPEQHKNEYRTRVGALLLQNHATAARVLRELQTWEPEIRRKYLQYD